MNEEQKQLIQKSHLFWGRQSQFDQLHEELGELIVALNHYKRNRCSLKDVAIEMADVRLMLNAIQVILGIDVRNTPRLKKANGQNGNRNWRNP